MKKSEKYMNTVKIGPKGQIVIPKEVRDMFGIEPGDQLMLLADSKRGIAINKMTLFTRIADAVFSGNAEKVCPGQTEEEARHFANGIRKAQNGEETILDEDSYKG